MSKPYLSAAELHLIQHCCDNELARLERLHWDAVAHGATDPLYRNLAEQRRKIEAARSTVVDIFETQFPAS